MKRLVITNVTTGVVAGEYLFDMDLVAAFTTTDDTVLITISDEENEDERDPDPERKA